MEDVPAVGCSQEAPRASEPPPPSTLGGLHEPVTSAARPDGDGHRNADRSVPDRAANSHQLPMQLTHAGLGHPTHDVGDRPKALVVRAVIEQFRWQR